MYEFALKGFRGFRDTDFVPVRPVTLLVGENSAGKSSFLAGLKYALEFAAADGEPSFNKDPFQLGTFQQIAHLRGGKAGRAREFSLKIRTVAQPKGRAAETGPAGTVTMDLTFTNADSQAAIQTARITLDNDDALVARADGDRITLSYETILGETHQLSGPDDKALPRIARSEFSRYWPFLLREIRYRLDRVAAGEKPSTAVMGRAATISHFADGFSASLRGELEATSAIRMKPFRTYTPGTEAHDGEGSHVPFEMAKLYRARSKEGWRRLKASVERFGHASDMFHTVSIKSFGQTVSDPFQLQFETGGPKTNIVDLGYGTSQVLPILYIVAAANPRTRFFIQQPEVHLHPKAQAALGTYFVEAFLRQQKEFVLETHSDFIVDRVRLAVANKDLPSDAVSILFFERGRLENRITAIELDEGGSPVEPPNSYRAFFLDEQMRSLGV